MYIHPSLRLEAQVINEKSLKVNNLDKYNSYLNVFNLGRKVGTKVDTKTMHKSNKSNKSNKTNKKIV